MSDRRPRVRSLRPHVAPRVLRALALARMSSASTRVALERWLASTPALPRARAAWMDACAEALEAEKRLGRVSARDLERAFASAVLEGDFNALALGGGLARAMADVRGGRARGRFVAQADAWTDVGARDAEARRCLQVSLTDGGGRFLAVEYERIDGLGDAGFRAGAKIALTDPYVGADGSIWLERATCAVLGGGVDRLERARLRAMAVMDEPNRPGETKEERTKRALRAAWEDERCRLEREDSARDVAGAAPTTTAFVPATLIVPDSLDVHSPMMVPGTPLEVLSVDVEEEPRANDDAMELDVVRHIDASFERPSAPASSSLSRERDSVPTSSRGAAVDERALRAARHLNATAIKGLWTYIAAVKAVRGDENASEDATIYGWITRMGRIEVQDDARAPLWRMKMQVSDPTGVTNVLLRNAQLEGVAETSVASYLAADAAGRKVIETAVHDRLNAFCGRIKIGGLKSKHPHVLKLDSQPTSLKRPIADALRARASGL